jgi:hypothetical protein
MPNAKDITSEQVGKPKFLLVGPTGSGKTSQACTLPGKTFAYLFDPSALATLRGQDVEYEEFVPERLNLGAVSLSKGKSDPKTKTDAPDIYTMWEKDFTIKQEEGYWDEIDNIVFDSFTTFSDIVMDRILFLNGRTGQFPQQDDWGGQMQTITNVVRTLTGMNKILLFTGHDEFRQDEASKRMQNTILLTGRLRVKVPLLFSDIWHMECVSTAGEHKYQAQTRPDKMNPAVRCTFRGLEMFHDMTIKDWSKPGEYGIGKLLRSR